jgi:hypothetical protein
VESSGFLKDLYLKIKLTFIYPWGIYRPWGTREANHIATRRMIPDIQKPDLAHV